MTATTTIGWATKGYASLSKAHLSLDGVPACGAKVPEGAILDSPARVTCAKCEKLMGVDRTRTMFTFPTA